MAQESFTSMLDEPKNSLGRTDEVVAAIEAKPDRMQELYECLLQPDEWVRLRASSTTKRIWKSHPEWLDPYLEGWVADVAAIDQPSVNWTFAQLCFDLADRLTTAQRERARTRLQGYLERSDDWIVLNCVIQTLAAWASTEIELANWLRPHLERLIGDPRTSVARRATRALAQLS